MAKIASIKKETIQLTAKNSKTQERTNPTDGQKQQDPNKNKFNWQPKIMRYKKESIQLMTKTI